jgi:hypothetical protein
MNGIIAILSVSLLAVLLIPWGTSRWGVILGNAILLSMCVAGVFALRSVIRQTKRPGR